MSLFSIVPSFLRGARPALLGLVVLSSGGCCLFYGGGPRGGNFTRLRLPLRVDGNPFPNLVVGYNGSSNVWAAQTSSGGSGFQAFDAGRFIGGVFSPSVRNFVFDDHYAILNTDRLVGRLDLYDGSYQMYTGFPSNGVLVDVWGGGMPGIVRAAFNVPGGSAIYTAGGGQLSAALNFSLSGTSLQWTGFSQMGRYVFGGHNDGASISTDGGGSFFNFGAGLPSPFKVSATNLSANWAFAGGASGVYRRNYTSAGPSFAKVNGLPTGTPTAITSFDHHVYLSLSLSASDYRVFHSNDDGANFSATASMPPGSINSLVALSTDRVVAATSAGLFRTPDSGASWVDDDCVTATSIPVIRHVPNLSFARAGETSALVTADVLLAGSGGNRSGIYRSTNGGAQFLAANSILDNMYTRSLAAVGGTLVAGGTLGSGAAAVVRSTDGGATWTVDPPSAVLGTNTVQVLLPLGTTLLGATVQTTSFGPSPGVALSTDAGLTWRASTGFAPSTYVYALANGDATTLVAGTFNAVYRSTDAGETWVKGGAPSPSANYGVLSLVGTGSTFYAGVYDYAANHHVVARSTDAGLTWQPRSTGLPETAPQALFLSGGALFAGMTPGLFRSTDGGGSWRPYGKKVENVAVTSLTASATTLFAGTISRGVVPLPLLPQARRLLPIALDVTTTQAHFTTEVSLSNRGTTDATLTMLYTPSLGRQEGSGSVSATLLAGQQLVIPDALAYLRGKGLAIPSASSDPQQGGTILVTFDGISDEDVAGVTARTAAATSAPQPAGRAGLAYSAIDPADGVTGQLAVYGLRSNANDRSNLAVFNTSDVPITLQVTAYSGSGEGPPKVIDSALALPPWGWHQFNGVLASAGFTNGWATVQQVSAGAAFSAYGVVNDQVTSDGSFLPPNTALHFLSYVNVPVLVEAGSFASELVLANSGTAAVDVALAYRESLSPGSGAGGTLHLILQAGEQRIIPNAIDFLRTNGVGIGAKGGSYAGSLHVTVNGASVAEVFAAARTASQSAAGGQFGTFTTGSYSDDEASDEAFLYGLQADDNNRTNVAVFHAGQTSAGALTLRLQAFDGEAAGAAKGSPVDVTLQPGEWHQENNFLKNAGVKNGWVSVTRTAGTASWGAYGIVNDGGAAGQATGDGALVPMVR